MLPNRMECKVYFAVAAAFHHSDLVWAVILKSLNVGLEQYSKIVAKYGVCRLALSTQILITFSINFTTGLFKSSHITLVEAERDWPLNHAPSRCLWYSIDLERDLQVQMRVLSPLLGVPWAIPCLSPVSCLALIVNSEPHCSPALPLFVLVPFVSS